jgi:hypothetical protein
VRCSFYLIINAFDNPFIPKTPTNADLDPTLTSEEIDSRSKEKEVALLLVLLVLLVLLLSSSPR